MGFRWVSVVWSGARSKGAVPLMARLATGGTCVMAGTTGNGKGREMQSIVMIEGTYFRILRMFVCM